MIQNSEFRIQNSEFRIQNTGVRIQESGVRGVVTVGSYSWQLQLAVVGGSWQVQLAVGRGSCRVQDAKFDYTYDSRHMTTTHDSRLKTNKSIVLFFVANGGRRAVAGQHEGVVGQGV